MIVRETPSPDGRDNRDAGFSLIEVLVSMTLFVIVAVGATKGIVSSLGAAHTGQQRVDAANVAQAVLAQAMGQGTALTTGATTFDSQVGDGTTAGQEQFSVTRTIGACSGGLRSVNIEVRQKQTAQFLARTDSVVSCVA